MKELGISLPPPPAKGGLYTQARPFMGNLIYTSGCGPVVGEPVKGRLGADFTVEQGQQHARNCMLNVLAVLQAEIGDLNRVKSVVKILTFVNSTDDFYDQPMVANGGSQLLLDIFGETVGLPARSAIGVNTLPGNIPVETEALFEIA
jgi:enamine deaminase RidA (YjgF/YER057c/UK114 family)